MTLRVMFGDGSWVEFIDRVSYETDNDGYLHVYGPSKKEVACFAAGKWIYAGFMTK